MNLADIFDLATNMAFPVLVSIFLLIRLEKQLSTLTTSINKLSNIISTQTGVAIDLTPINKAEN